MALTLDKRPWGKRILYDHEGDVDGCQIYMFLAVDRQTDGRTEMVSIMDSVLLDGKSHHCNK